MSFSQQKTRVRSLVQAGQSDAASRLLLALVEKIPGDEELWQLLVTLSRMPGVYEGAARVHLTVANRYRALGDAERAQQAYRRAISSRPQAAELHYNLGTLQQELGENPQAVQSYRQALKLKPQLLQGWNNLGLVYQEQGRLEDALACFNRGLEQASSQESSAVAEIHRHRALLWLLSGDFRQGWPEYEWRHTDPSTLRRSFAAPAWDGRMPLSDQTILVCAEQGIGDEILFASCIPVLARRAKRVVLECSPRLAPLFGRAFTDVGIVHRASDAAQAIASYPDIDVVSPAGSLPGHLGVDRASPASPNAWLQPDTGLLQKWQDRYAALGSALKVGVSWRGGGEPAKRAKRSTRLEQWLGVFARPHAQFVSLQYGDCRVELDALHARHSVCIHDWPDADPLLDLDDFAAQVAALDLVISVDNAAVHMAGALGVPVWILQPFMPEWRWLMDSEDSYWYSSVRQFRQPRAGDWPAVFAGVEAELAATWISAD